ncbi:MAG TPA: ribosome silencing factor [Ignavibacteriaceae bacterium]|nr:MAG: Ribosomal silencing factor RsfS [Ignavibacteria bacterium ADurb.Bin266]OQY74253.1 MAG: ribosome silencing factor [Ignavibacteriales bacterium UTCHB2]HQF43784.1 ribosome silencing factor [Ignavibacteriaceae bacterium]HQI40031.1 ribosome silencing factor [Ignavibacteriaceae bacterium]HQJ45317.1 ribosome silencing factor [Ignavibacteriaceae bacterium]
MNSKKVAEQIANLIFNKKGYDVKIIDLKEITSFADYFVICSADSDTQVKAIADEIDEKLREKGIKYWHKEGMAALSWVLLDYVDVVVHIFKKESREFYNIEKLWGDAPIFDVQDPIEAKKEKAKSKPKTTRKTTTAKSKKE